MDIANLRERPAIDHELTLQTIVVGKCCIISVRAKSNSASTAASSYADSKIIRFPAIYILVNATSHQHPIGSMGAKWVYQSDGRCCLMFLRQALYIPNAERSRRAIKSSAMPTLSFNIFILLPPTSFQPIGTSTTKIFDLSASMSISTSKIQPWECIYGSIYGKHGLEKSLKPHWVSFNLAVAAGASNRRNKWKRIMRKLRSLDRYVD